jgi:hypothetical protein
MMDEVALDGWKFWMTKENLVKWRAAEKGNFFKEEVLFTLFFKDKF